MKKTTAVGGDIMAMAPTAEAAVAVHAPARGVHVHAHVRDVYKRQALGLTLGSALVSFAATGWAEENGEWVYYQKDGSKATDVFAKSGNNWFYLDSDGTMAKSQLIEKDDNYYYVNSAGAMVTSEWREVENEEIGRAHV